MKSPVRILYLAPCWPTEGLSGWQLRTFQILGALQEFGRVDCMVVSHGGDRPVEPVSNNLSCVRRVVELKQMGPRSTWSRLRCGLDARHMGYFGHTISESDRLSVLDSLSSYNLVWLHHLRTANVFGRWSWPRSVMDLDDVQSLFAGTVQRTRCRFGQRLRERLRANIARRRERLLGERFNILSVCSEADRKYLGFENKTHVIPNGFAKPLDEPARRIVQPPRIGFIGAFDYAPNSDGVQWFVEECWPRIKEQVPDARLRLVGKGSDGICKPEGQDIDGLGWVKDARAEIATWSVMAVPVRTGTGTRIKIAEGFSRKCPIVSTSIGAYGYETSNGYELLLADTAADFTNACTRLIRQPKEAGEMAERAWQCFLKKWTWDCIRPSIFSTAEDCLRCHSDS
jgi:polysaccharide biosynthesis protein PslH